MPFKQEASKAKKHHQAMKLLPTQAKAIRKGAMAKELREKAENIAANNDYRNRVLLATRARNYQMEYDRLQGVLAHNRLINNRESQLLQSRRNILQHHINYYEPIIGHQGQYSHV